MIFEIKNEFPCSYKLSINKMKSFSPEESGYNNKFPSPWSHHQPSRPHSATYRRFPPPWSHNREIDRREYPRTFYQHRGGRSNRRRRSHLDDVYRTNYEEFEDECSSHGNGCMDQNSSVAKKSYPQTRDHSQENKRNKSKINIKLNGKSCDRNNLKSNLVLCSEESKSNGLSNKVPLENNMVDLIDESLPKTCSASPEDVPESINQKQLDEMVCEIPNQEITIDLTEDILSTPKYDTEDTVAEDLFGISTEVNTITLPNETTTKGVSESKITCVEPTQSDEAQILQKRSVEMSSKDNEPRNLYCSPTKSPTSDIVENNINDGTISMGKKPPKDINEHSSKDINVNFCEGKQPPKFSELINEQRNNVISIPFFEDVSAAKPSHNDNRTSCTSSADQTKNSILTPEKYLMLCESRENLRDQKKKDNIKDTDVGSLSPKKKSNETHNNYAVVDTDASISSPRRKLDKTCEKYPEINSQILLQEIDAVLRNNNTKIPNQNKETSISITEVCENNLGKRQQDSSPTLTTPNEDCSQIDPNVAKQKENINQLEEIVSNKALLSLLAENKYCNTKQIIDEVNRKTYFAKEAKAKSLKKKFKSDRVAKNKSTQRKHNQRGIKSSKKIFSDRPYLKKFYSLFGDTEDISQETKERLETSQKFGKITKKKPRHKFSHKAENKNYARDTNIRKKHIKERWSESELKQIMDNVNANHPQPHMKEVIIVLNRIKCNIPKKEEQENETKPEKKVTMKKRPADDKTVDLKDSKRSKIESSEGGANLEFPFKIHNSSQSDLQQFDSVCSIVQQFDTFPSLCRARTDVILNEHCDEAVTLDQPDILQNTVSVSNVDTSDDVIEIKPDIPLIDLTESRSNIEETNIQDSKEDLMAMLKQEPAPSEKETITLYRSDLTVDDNLELQAQSAVISESVKHSNHIDADHKFEKKLSDNVEESNQLMSKSKSGQLNDIAIVEPAPTIALDTEMEASSSSEQNGPLSDNYSHSNNNNFILDVSGTNQGNVEHTSSSMTPPNVSIADVMAAEMRLKVHADKQNIKVNNTTVIESVVPSAGLVLHSHKNNEESRYLSPVHTTYTTNSHLNEEDCSLPTNRLANLPSESQLITKLPDKSSAYLAQDGAYSRNATNLNNATECVIPTQNPLEAVTVQTSAPQPGSVPGNNSQLNLTLNNFRQNIEQAKSNIAERPPVQIQQHLNNRGKDSTTNVSLLNAVRSNNFSKEIEKQSNGKFPTELLCTKQVMMNMAQLSRENNVPQKTLHPPSVRRVSTEQVDKIAQSQTPRRQSTDNLNDSIVNQDQQMLQEITNIFIRIVISCVHIRKHQLIYLQSVKELNDFVPEVVQLQTHVAIKQYENTLVFLGTKLATDLKATCKKKNIDFDANKWFDDLFQNAQMFLESFTKLMLITLLKRLMLYHRDFYLSIPYLKALFQSIKGAVDKFHEISNSRHNLNSMQEEQRQLLKLQIDQYHRTLAVVPQIFVSENNSSVSSPASSTSSRHYSAIQTSHSSHIISSNLPKQTSKSSEETSLFYKSNPELLRSLIYPSCTNYTQNMQFPGTGINNEVQNTINPLSKDTLNSQNSTPLKILSNVVINPGNRSGSSVPVTPQSDNFRVRLHLSTPYDSHSNLISGVSRTSSEQVKETRNSSSATYASQVHNPLGASPSYTIHHHPNNNSSPNTSQRSSAAVRQATPFHVPEAYSNFNQYVNKYFPVSSVTNGTQIFKAPKPVSQERLNLLDVQRMSVRNVIADTAKNSVPRYLPPDVNNQLSKNTNLRANINCAQKSNLSPGYSSPNRVNSSPTQIYSSPMHFTGTSPMYLRQNDQVQIVDNNASPYSWQRSPNNTGSRYETKQQGSVGIPHQLAKPSCHPVGAILQSTSSPGHSPNSPHQHAVSPRQSERASHQFALTPVRSIGTICQNGSEPYQTGCSFNHIVSTSCSTESALVRKETLPIQADSTSSQSGSTPSQNGSTPSQNGDMSSQSGNTSSQSGSTPSQSGNSPSQTGSTPSHTESTPSQTESTPSQTGKTPVHQTATTPLSQNGSTPRSECGSTPDQLVPPALRNIKSPVYAPMLFSPRSYVDETDESELTDSGATEIIDLTWMDDVDPQTLQNELNGFYLKKEEFDEDEVILNQEQFPVAQINGPLWMSPWEPSRQDPG